MEDEPDQDEATIPSHQPTDGPSLPAFQSSAKVKKRTKAPRNQIAVACLPCQKRKCRCDGTRPICTTCTRRGKVCQYNVDEGLSRVAHLKEKNKTLEEDSKDLRTVIELLRKGTDSDAAAVLARLRVGHTISSIVQHTQTPGSQSLPDRPRITPENIEIDVSSGLPTQLHHSRIINRHDWGRSTRPRGATSYSQQLTFRGSQHQPRSQFPTSASHPQPQAVNIPTVVGPSIAAQAIHLPNSSRLDLQSHEADPARLRNFGNMDFSSGILANGYPWDIQRQQVSNLFTPQWAKMTVPVMLPEDHAMKIMSDSLIDTLSKCRQMLASGTSLLELAGPHPRLAAIMNDDEFNRAPFLSQWASRMVFSIKETNTLFVCYASMYLFWWIMRWMIAPSPETYFAIPEFLRPSPTQLFMPHLLPLEFFAWPGLRDYLVRVPEKFDSSDWMLDMSLNIGCACPLEKSEIMAPSPVDGELELSPRALAHASNVDSWSVTPSFRQYFLDAGKYFLSLPAIFSQDVLQKVRHIIMSKACLDSSDSLPKHSVLGSYSLIGTSLPNAASLLIMLYSLTPQP